MRVSVLVAVLLPCCSSPSSPGPPASDRASADPRARWWEDGETACERVELGSELVSRHLSPAGEFEVLLCRIPRFFAFPGQGSDAPGKLALVDTRTGTILERQSLEMVQMMESPSWSRLRVTMGVSVDWPLPEEDPRAIGRRTEGPGREIFYRDGKAALIREPGGR